MRYTPQRPFPRYAYVPSRQPHPVTDPQGHSFGISSEPAAPLDPSQPHDSEEFLFAIDLFNAGYYWEAHESWERLWLAAGRAGPVAALLKGLIKLAAAGVKSREGNLAGVRRHAIRAAELLSLSEDDRLKLQGLFESIDGLKLLSEIRAFADQPTVDTTPVAAGLCVLPMKIVFQPRTVHSES